jgi:hypothetical protein
MERNGEIPPSTGDLATDIVDVKKSAQLDAAKEVEGGDAQNLPLSSAERRKVPEGAREALPSMILGAMGPDDGGAKFKEFTETAVDEASSAIERIRGDAGQGERVVSGGFRDGNS